MTRRVRRTVAAAAIRLSIVCLLVTGTAAFADPVQLLDDGNTSVHRFESTCNSYIIQRGDRAVLIDLGDAGVLDHVESLGIRHVDWILFTGHQRERNQGFLRVDRKKTKLAAPADERELFEDPTALRKWHPSLGDKYSVYGASYVRPPRLPIPLDRHLADDERFSWAGIDIRCLATPGNSPGGMTYLCRVGDKTVAFTGGLMHSGARMVTWFDTEWDYGFAKGIDVLKESVERLIETPADLLLPAHGPAVDQPRRELTDYREKLAGFRARYIRGYPVFDMSNEERDPISTPTAVPGLSRVTEHLYKLSDSKRGWNFAIIISDAGRGLILDCGLLPREMLEEMIVGMRQHLGLKQIDAFWISHMHGDHFLLGPLLREKYGAESWTLDRVVDPIENPRRYDYAALVSAYGNGFDGMPIDKAFRDGEAVEWEGYRIQVDWMPGQTEFGCSLWLEIDGKRIVFTGDNLFGNPADPQQDGHEAVVARNSCIFEEGYLHAANYLLKLEPDIVMGSHSYVMPEPREFLERYRAWATEIIDIYRDLLPETHYEYRFDPYWVSAYPYRVELADEEPQSVAVTVRNFRDAAQHHRIVLKTPPGVVAEPSVLEGSVSADSRETFPVTLTAQGDAAAGIGIVAMDITLDEYRYGEWFDFMIRVGAEQDVDSESTAAQSGAEEQRANWPSLTDIEGRAIRPFDDSTARALALIFILPDCPIANSYAPELTRLYREFKDRGIEFLLIHVDPTMTVEQARRHAEQYQLEPPVVIDTEHDWVTRAGITRAPEAAVFSPAGRLLYRGRIDDRYPDWGKRRPQAGSHDLRDALEAILAGEPVAKPRTEAVGCFVPPLSLEK